LRVACEFIRHGVIVGGIGVGVRGEMQNGGIEFGVIISTLMIDESAVIGSEFGSKGAIGIDIHGFALLIKQVILALLDVEAA
jgi:hypothetical protein